MTEINNGLWKAADVIRDLGFTKKSLKNSAGRVCALGGLSEAYGQNFGDNTSTASTWLRKNHPTELKTLADTIKELYPKRVSGSSDADVVVNFNDHAQTKDDDVVKVFRVAGVKLAVGI